MMKLFARDNFTKEEMSGSPLFEPSNLEWEAYIGLGKKMHYPRGSVVFYANSCLNNIYYLEFGVVKQVLISPEGTEKVVGIIKSGNIFGEAIFLHGYPAQCTNVVTEDALIYSFSREDLEKMISANPSILMYLVRSMSLKIRMLTTQIDILYSLDAKSKVCRTIQLLVQQSKELRMTHQEIAQLAGVHRVTVSNTLSFLKLAGVIDCVDRYLVVRDEKALAALAKGNKT